jgi:hypothetical protein
MMRKQLRFWFRMEHQVHDELAFAHWREILKRFSRKDEINCSGTNL